jgi:hypothetical protein
MPKKPRVIGLEGFRLSLAGLKRLGDRPVRLTVQLVGRSVSALRHLRPRQREARLRDTLADQLERLRRRFPEVEFISRGKRKPSWTIDAVLPARHVLELASKPEVNHVHLDTIEGRSQNPRRHGPRWFCVWGVVAVQIEEQVQGFITLEDRLVLVRANDPDDAQHKLQGKWSKYAEPYLNPNGYLVRWQLVNVRDVYELFEDTLDPRGTEVYSRLRKARLRPEYRWRPTGSTNRTRSN